MRSNIITWLEHISRYLIDLSAESCRLISVILVDITECTDQDTVNLKRPQTYIVLNLRGIIEPCKLAQDLIVRILGPARPGP